MNSDMAEGQPRNLCLFADGTWNRGGSGRPTNVWKLHQLIDRSDPSQITIHDNGVGTGQNIFSKVLGGAFGFGLHHNVRDLYEFLVQHYRPGDRIFMFGFSRGAFTVRLLSGVIQVCGILDLERLKGEGIESSKEAARLALRVFRLAQTMSFRQKNQGLSKIRTWLCDGDNSDQGQRLRENYAFPDAKITFLGVWDTVRAFGGPFDGAINLFDQILCLSFADNKMATCVEFGAHALAIDEARRSFLPITWDEDPRVEQLWFAGAHSDVGGGYEKQGLAGTSLAWMIKKLEDDGAKRNYQLRLAPGAAEKIRAEANPHGTIHDSRAGKSFFYRYGPREIAKGPVHWAALTRLAHGTNDYAPTNLHVSQPKKNPTATFAGSILDSYRWITKVRFATHSLAVIMVLAVLIFVPVFVKTQPENSLVNPPAPRALLSAISQLGVGLSPFDPIDARIRGVEDYIATSPRSAGIVLGLIAFLTVTSWTLGRLQKSMSEKKWKGLRNELEENQ